MRRAISYILAMRTGLPERILASLLLILFSPFFLMMCFFIRRDGGPLFFKQKRLGKNKKPFLIYKFRTMIVGAEKLQGKYRGLNEAETPVFKIYHDPRYTRLGKFLAHTGLDELPQLINILKGEMKFVGPRPLPVYEAVKVPKRYSLRFSVMPGIASLWIVEGAHTLSFKRWMELDMKQIKEGSLLMDASVIVRTIFLVLFSFMKRVKNHVLWGSLGLILCLGSLGVANSWILAVQGIGIILASIIMIKAKRKTSFPPGVFFFLVFLGVLVREALTRSSIQAGFETLFLFAGGFLLWVIGHNFASDLKERFSTLLVWLGVVMSVMFAVWHLSGGEVVLPKSLYTASSAFRNHNHLGDLWAVVLLIPLYQLIRKPNLGALALTVLGGTLIGLSLSRSAVVSAVFGVGFLFAFGGTTNKKKPIFLLAVGVLLLVFVMTSMEKTTFSSRPYFSQAVAGLQRYPWGVGIGNFKIASFNFEPETFSYSAHNLFLETLTELGWPGVTLVFWAVYSLARLLTTTKEGLIYRAIFLSLLVNFFFDSTYKIPTMIWILFLSLGLGNGKRNLR